MQQRKSLRHGWNYKEDISFFLSLSLPLSLSHSFAREGGGILSMCERMWIPHKSTQSSTYLPRGSNW